MVIEAKQRLLAKISGFRIGDPLDTADHEFAELESQCLDVAAEFDAVFYAVRYPEIRGNLLRHFMETGWREEKDPARWFSTSFYLETYPDVRTAGLNPFYHYVKHGRAEGRFIAPAEHFNNDRSWEIEAIRQGLDEVFYSRQLHAVGVDPSGLDLALHYWREGASLGLDPSEGFSTSHYVAAHEDVAAAGVNPFAHYLEQGKREGRSAIVAQPRASSNEDHERGLVGSEFDTEYYLSAYPDIAAAGVDSLAHFLSVGWREGRNPNLWFSVSNYLESYPDVDAAGINPFVHYLLAGKTEGRLPRHDLGFRYDIIKSLQPLEDRVGVLRSSFRRPKLSRRESLREAFRRARGLETAGIYVTVSHDDFTQNFGGVQLVLMRESVAVAEMGLDHLHLFPSAPLPIADFDAEEPIVGVLLNGQRIGFFLAGDIERELAAVATRIRTSHFAVHSLIGHRAEAILSVLTAAGCHAGWYWVHDYSSVCAGYTLLRNDVEFCGAPPPSSSACSICVYGGLRAQQIKAHELLFEKLDLTVLAPSRAALDVWKAGASVVAPAKVHEHMRLAISQKRGRKGRSSVNNRPLRVAYVGQAVSHKGWPVFKDLAVTFGKDSRYRFYHVGKDQQPGIPVIFREVAVGPDDLGKMVRTLNELEIDVALIWSLWPETFCIAAVEALEAGAAVLTFKDSGNVAALVNSSGFGAVLDSEDDLRRLFDSGDVRELVAQTQPRGLSAEFSNMTVDFLREAIA